MYSREIDILTDIGYKFQILKGYEFKTEVIFKGYVDQMYSLRQQYDKDNPLNQVAKLLMNSLYGKFGMNSYNDLARVVDLESPDAEETLFKSEEAQGLFNTELISDIITIDERFVVLVHKNVANFIHGEDDFYHGVDVNIAIASSITAMARLYMSQWKNRKDINLYYSDTYSIVVDRPINEQQVGSALGQFKLEHEISNAVFLAQKVYGFKTLDGVEHIKVKGVKKECLKDFHLDDMWDLLIKDSKIEFQQTKWYKKILEGTIEIADIAYQLKATSNKRLPIYRNIGGTAYYSNTKPYFYSDVESSVKPT